MAKTGYVYLMTNRTNKVLYTGVTSDLKKRVYEHREGITEGFTNQYKVNKLVYYEQFDSVTEAIRREKQLKGGSRNKKLQLIETRNPSFDDLYEKI